MPNKQLEQTIEALAAHQAGAHRVLCPLGGFEHGALEPMCTDQGIVLRCHSCGHSQTTLPTHIDPAPTFDPEPGRTARDIAHQPPPC